MKNGPFIGDFPLPCLITRWYPGIRLLHGMIALTIHHHSSQIDVISRHVATYPARSLLIWPLAAWNLLPSTNKLWKFINLPSGKFTVRPWKSPILSENSSSNPDDCQGRAVNLLEGNGKISIKSEDFPAIFHAVDGCPGIHWSIMVRLKWSTVWLWLFRYSLFPIKLNSTTKTCENGKTNEIGDPNYTIINPH